MARKKNPTPMEENTIIAPVSVEQVTVTVQQDIEVPPGYVLLVALNEDGTEKPRSEFFYPEKSYRKYYDDETKFKLKTTNTITDNPLYHENLNRTSQQIIRTTTGRCSSCGR